MRSRGPGRLTRRSSTVAALTAALGLAVVVAGALPSGTPAVATSLPPSVSSSDPGPYLVTLRDAPAASYDGGDAGLDRTRPRPGQRFDRTRPAVNAYVDRLTERQDQVLAEIGSPTTLYRYTAALNGFAVTLSTEQVKQLRALPEVTRVEQVTVQRLMSGDATQTLGLTGPNGTWADVGGVERAGRDVVVATVDSGIWPENPSFASLPGAATSQRSLPGFRGACQAGEQWTTETCNDKVVSARWFVDGFGADDVAQSEYLSPRDAHGHGTHVAAVAAGNEGVEATVAEQRFGEVSGMAPAARLAVYKACWTAPDPADDGCSTADTLAAVDHAVADGVDVLNYSVSSPGMGTTLDEAFRHASAAGVFVSAAAGNNGPAPGSVQHASPWVTTVAAGTHRLMQGAVVLGNGRRLVGEMVSTESVRAPLVTGADAASDGSDARAAARCEADALDATAVEGKVVVCERGVVPRVDKSAAVNRAGGAGMILVNTYPQGTEADVHAVPTVHLDHLDGRAVLDHAAKPGAEVVLDPRASDDTPVPRMAEFSGRGPADDPDLLKPDLTAPGSAVLAAVARSGGDSAARLWDLRSGTSVSAAHVSGLAALLKARRPSWSPSVLKSALMTTSTEIDGIAGPLAQGAGYVDPSRMLDPGLAFELDRDQSRRFAAGAIPGRRLNLPSLAVGELVGGVTVTRTLTHVGRGQETYTATSNGLPGIDVRVRPATVTLDPGESATVRIRLRVTPDAGLEQLASGAITWAGSQDHAVRIPVVARPITVAAPENVTAPTESGGTSVTGRSGSGGAVDLRPVGLVGSTPEPLSLVPGDLDLSSGTVPEADAATRVSTVEVSEGARILRVLVDGDNSEDDLDLYLFRDGSRVAEITDTGAQEQITLTDPAPGTYQVVVHAAAAGDGSSATGQVYSWVIGTGQESVDLTTRPSQVEVGADEPFGYDVVWDDLDPSQRWLGAVEYEDSGRVTLVEVD